MTKIEILFIMILEKDKHTLNNFGKPVVRQGRKAKSHDSIHDCLVALYLHTCSHFFYIKTGIKILMGGTLQ